MKPLVSIITPCFNGESFIDRYFKSLLDQEYTNCQLIFMNDGSTDNTEGLVKKYIPLIEEKGMTVEYHYHDNIGIGATIAEGLGYVKGDYYIWPDIDDLLTPDSIRKKVDFLEDNPDYGIVRSECKVVLENDINTAVDYPANRYGTKNEENLFENCLLFKKFYFQPGCYMIRTKTLLNINPERYIFPSRDGQNIQMLLPVLYASKCGYIDEPLYIYIKNEGSISNSIKKDFVSQIRKWDSYEEIMISTIQNTKIVEKEKYIALARNNFAKMKIDTCFEFGKKNEAQKYYTTIKNNSGSDLKYFLKSAFAGSILFKKAIDIRRAVYKK